MEKNLKNDRRTNTEKSEDDVTFSAYDRNLIGRNGKPLRFYTRDGKPVTDFDGDPLQSITGRVLLSFNTDTNQIEDISGFPLRDCWGRLPSNPEFNPEEGTNPDPCIGPLVQKTGQPRVIFDVFGSPLTDNKGRPLVNAAGKYLLTFDARGEPVCDAEGRLFIECPSFFNIKNVERLYDTSTGKPLQIFDAFKRPLTSIEGFPFLDIFGETLVIADNQNNPIKTIYGSDIYDCNGRPSTHIDYDPTRKNIYWKTHHPIVDENGNPLVLFDQTGFPLTDDCGVPLVDSQGLLLFKNDKKRGIISNDGIDVIQLSASNYNPNFLRSICNNVGKPARFFNFQGKPVTNWLGEILKHADGCILTTFDCRGSPKCDYQGLPIYDEYGVSIMDDNCTPFESSQLNDDFPRETDALKNGIKLYDGSGMPVTDHRGFHLTNASRNFMIIRNSNGIPVSDFNGGPLFTECGLPLVKSLDEPLLGPKDKICRLFDHRGYPLTNNHGVPLKLMNGECTIKIDKIGRIIGDWLGGSVYDRYGVSMTFCRKFNPSKAPKKISRSVSKHYNSIKNTKQLFSRSGFPLTDKGGELLSNSRGKSLICIDYQNNRLADICGHGVYESAGFLYKPDRSIFFTNESPAKTETCSRKMEENKEMKNFAELSRGFSQRCKSSDLIMFDGRYKIYDRDSFPLLDRYGAVLETSENRLVVKFDEQGKIYSDFRGNDIYDRMGIPLTNVTGFWKDKRGNPLRLFTQSGFPLTDSKGKALCHLKGFCLLGRDEIGRPLVDYNNCRVYDAKRNPSNDRNFCPGYQPDSDQLCPLLDLNEKPMQIYNSKGWPLNDENGFPLVNNQGINLISFNNLGLESIEDNAKGTVYDSREIPLGYKKDTPLLTMSGSPFRLFNKVGEPLTDFMGVPLKFTCDLCMIVFDMFGRPIQDLQGGGLFDNAGHLLGTAEFKPDIVLPPKKRIKRVDDVPVRLFDQSGKPLTDAFGNLLVNAKGEDLIYTNVPVSNTPISVIDGSPLCDDQGKLFVATSNIYIEIIGK